MAKKLQRKVDKNFDILVQDLLGGKNKKTKKRFRKLLQEMLDQVETMNKETKRGDYENEDIQFVDYFQEGLRDLWCQLNGKVLRLKSLVGRKGKVRTPNHESLMDNALDLAGYALWFASWAKTLRDKKE